MPNITLKVKGVEFAYRSSVRLHLEVLNAGEHLGLVGEEYKIVLPSNLAVVLGLSGDTTLKLESVINE